MGFDVLSAATAAGQQLENRAIENSMVSKMIHDQAETSFCWAFAISSMLRQSIKMFFKTTGSNETTALLQLNENQFHKRLRNEMIMLPIPKTKFLNFKVPKGVDPDEFEEEIIGKQSHVLENAINRVSLYHFMSAKLSY